NEDSWCLVELRDFEEARRRDQRKRIFPIEFLPLDDHNDYPAAVQKLTRSQFWRLTQDRVPIPIRPGTSAFDDCVWGLGGQIARHLKCMRTASPIVLKLPPSESPPVPPAARDPFESLAQQLGNAGRLVVSQVASTARQEHQRRSQERGFDDGEHARDPLFISSR